MIMDEYTDYNAERLLAEYRQLLMNLKTTAEGLFLSQVCNVWNVYGGLNRLHNAVECIFKHGTRVYKPDGSPDSWLFIEGLSWINPSLNNTTETNTDTTAIPYARIKNDKALSWIYRSLENHTLSQKLSWLISDKEHLSSCFEKGAYLCQERYSEATLICLRAIEQNQPSIITDIEPYLFLNRSGVKQLHKSHRRCSSYPEFVSCQIVNVKKEPIVEHCMDAVDTIYENMGNRHSMIEIDYMKIAAAEEPYKDRDNIQHETKRTPRRHKKRRRRNDYLLKSWSSFPTVTNETQANVISRNDSIHSFPDDKRYSIGEEVSTSFTKQDGVAGSQDSITIVNCDDIKIHTHNAVKHEDITKIDETPLEVKTPTMTRPVHLPLKKRFSFFSWDSGSHLNELTKSTSKLSLLPNSAPGFLFNNIQPRAGEKIKNTEQMKTFIEDGGSSILPMATGFVPQPAPGQSLTSFLTSSQFHRANAELDRENAHFSISEAMIAAVEQLKWNRIQRTHEDLLESDEEINNLKQRIRMRRRQRQQEKYRIWHLPLMSDGKTDTTTESVSPLSSSDTCDSDVSESIDLDLETCGKLKDFEGLSVSLGSLYESSELLPSAAKPLHVSTPCNTTNSTITTPINNPIITASQTSSKQSAEAVALNLLSRFNESQLPRASELIWLVSERDAPQRMLPMPEGWADDSRRKNGSRGGGSAKDAEVPQLLMRGTLDWAPPRAQVIFTPHPTPVRKQLLSHQNWRCTGCAMRVAEQYANRFRYCEYLGRYHCTGCHNNQVSAIPGRVLSKWDFKRYPVSNFSYRLLERMWYDPLFRVGSVAPALYGKVRALARSKLLREKLYHVKEFILTCRYADNLHIRFKNEPSHMCNEPDVWSMADFIQVKHGELVIRLSELVKACEIHINNCELCNARGFVCEVCSRDVIFPWQNNVTRCTLCGSCYHSSCWNPSLKCSKCFRIQSRKHL